MPPAPHKCEQCLPPTLSPNRLHHRRRRRSASSSSASRIGAIVAAPRVVGMRVSPGSARIERRDLGRIMLLYFSARARCLVRRWWFCCCWSGQAGGRGAHCSVVLGFFSAWCYSFRCRGADRGICFVSQTIMKSSCSDGMDDGLWFL